MKKPVLKELARYSAAAIAIIGSQQDTEAQIVYRDIPDTLMAHDDQHNIFVLDLNSDGKSDFRFKAGFFEDAYISAGMTGNSMIAMTASESEVPVMYPIRLSYSFPIGVNSPWGKRTFGLLANGTSGGDTQFDAIDDMPHTVIDGYLGMRFRIGDNVHYGWARIDALHDASWMLIKDFAYNATPGAAINAGQKTDAKECRDGFEPNDKSSNATLMSPNVEYKGLIDKHYDENQKTEGGTPTNPETRQIIEKKGLDKDFFKFEIKPDAPHLQISLSNLDKNYNLELRDASGKRIGRSTNKQTADETIILNNAAPGWYYSVVYLNGNSRIEPPNCYSIMVKTSKDPFIATETN